MCCHVNVNHNGCRHIYSYFVHCGSIHCGSAREETVTLESVNFCEICFTVWADRDLFHGHRNLPNGENRTLSAADKVWAETLWQRIRDINAVFREAEGMIGAPYMGRIMAEDVDWLKAQIGILEASWNFPQTKVGDADHRLVELIINMRSTIVDIVGRRSKPRFLIPADLSILNEDEQHCVCCTVKFGQRPDGEAGGEAESAVRFPCHFSHVVGAECGKMILQSGMKCPWCNAHFDPADFLTEGEGITSPWWMKRLRDG